MSVVTTARILIFINAIVAGLTLAITGMKLDSLLVQSLSVVVVVLAMAADSKLSKME